MSVKHLAFVCVELISKLIRDDIQDHNGDCTLAISLGASTEVEGAYALFRLETP